MTKDIRDAAKSAGLEECQSLILSILERIDTVLEWTSELQRKQAFSDERISRLDARLEDIEQRLPTAAKPPKVVPTDRSEAKKRSGPTILGPW